MLEDAQLLRRYADDQAEDAFAEFVRRRVNLVYGIALRKVGGDVHLAQDVTQRVFTDLARKAAMVARHPVVAGWLFTSTHYAATQLVRRERRRRAREAKAHAMNEPIHDSAPLADWESLRPVLDDLIHDLGERDREAVLLRFFEGRSLAEVGERLRLTEDGARSRVDRALAKMRTILARRGIVSTEAALGLVLANQVGVAAPAGFPATIASAALASAAATTSAAGFAVLGSLFTMNKINIGLAGVLIVAGSATAIREVRASQALRAERETQQFARDELHRLRVENDQLSAGLGAFGQNRSQIDELVRARARITQLKARPEGVVDSAMKPVSTWSNVGRATPIDAYETIRWAEAVGDLDVFATFITFVPRAKAKVDAFFAALPEAVRLKYGTPEKMIAASKPARNDLVAFQITGRTEHGLKTVVHGWTRDASGRERKGDMVLQRYEDGWRAAPFSDQMADGILASLDPLTGERRPETK